MDLPYLSYQCAIFHPFISTSHGQEDMKGSKEASGAKKRLGGEVTWEEDWSFIPWWVLWGVEEYPSVVVRMGFLKKNQHHFCLFFSPKFDTHHMQFMHIYIYMYARFRNVRGIVADLALPATAKVRKKSSCEFPQWPYVTIRRLRRGKLRPRDEASHISSMEAYGACSRVAATMTGKHCFKRQ